MFCSGYFTYPNGQRVDWDVTTQRLYPVQKDEIGKTIEEVNKIMKEFVKNAEQFDYWTRFWNYGTYLDIASLHCNQYNHSNDCLTFTEKLLQSVREANNRLLATSPPKEIEDTATRMYSAIAKGEYDVVRECLANGVSANGVNESGWPYLCSACIQNWHSIP